MEGREKERQGVLPTLYAISRILIEAGGQTSGFRGGH